MLVLFIFVSAFCGTNTKFNIAHQLYMKSNYVMAITHFDQFLTITQDGALATQAELERSDCYYQLGYKALSKENWLLASRLFFLSNSDMADSELDDCYFHLAKKQLLENSPSAALEYYEKITSFLKDSEYIPEILFNRIKIYLDMNNKLAAFDDYHFLWEHHPENSYTKEIQPFIDNLMPSYIQEALNFRDSKDYDVTINMLTKLGLYPSGYQDEIFEYICDIYQAMADNSLAQKDYAQVRKNLDLALLHDYSKNEAIAGKTRDICSQIIKEGNKLVTSFQFDEAIEIFEQCYILIPDYTTCTNIIDDTNNRKQDYHSALEYEEQANQLEKKKEYSSAKTYYSKSYNLFKTDRVKEKIYLMNNLIRAGKNPKSFAESIIKEYKHGVIPARIQAMEKELIDKYKDRVESSGWKVHYAIGDHKFEVRYDLLSPEENYYFAWHVNLKNRKITSLNKLSEQVLKR